MVYDDKIRPEIVPRAAQLSRLCSDRSHDTPRFRIRTVLVFDNEIESLLESRRQFCIRTPPINRVLNYFGFKKRAQVKILSVYFDLSDFE